MIKSGILKSEWVCGLIFLLSTLQSPLAQVIAQRADSGEHLSPDRLSGIIRVSSNLISVPVSVTDAAGHTVRDLNIRDFQIAEDGKPVEISKLADASQSPVNFALLFDLSGSVNSRFEFEHQAATDFLKKIWKPGDTISIIPFTEDPQIRLQNSRSLADALKELGRLQPTQGATAFFDAVAFSARVLHQAATPETRQALIAVSDGADNRSDRDMAATLRELQRFDAIFYAINPSGASVRLNKINFKGQEDLAALAKATGGTSFVSDRSVELESIFDRIAAELRSQYLLSYYSLDAHGDDKFHAIDVTLPNRPDLRIRARLGYIARGIDR